MHVLICEFIEANSFFDLHVLASTELHLKTPEDHGAGCPSTTSN